MTEFPVVPEADTLRQEMTQHHVGSPRYQELSTRLEQAYRKAHGAPAATTPPPSPTDAPPEPAGSPSREDIAAKLAAIGDPHSPEAAAKSAFPDFAAPPGHALDVGAVVELRGMELSHDVPVAELTALTTEYRQAWERRGQDTETRRDARDAALLEAWGDDYELELTRATEMAQRIPKRVLAHALQAGMHYDPVLWLKLSELWKKQHAR